jgi:tRNA threonylcarbamoyladenosine biosynthesis protein TsaB
MLLLAFDTATPVGSVCLLEDERLLAARYFDAGQHHSQHLFVELDGVFEVAGCEPTAVEAVAVTIGPGSFTGLRIGLSAAKGFCLARGAVLVPVPTLEALAARLPFSRMPVLALLDARRGEVYAGLYDTSGGPPQLLEGPRADEPQAIFADWNRGPMV